LERVFSKEDIDSFVQKQIFSYLETLAVMKESLTEAFIA
jgi:hypothetical protein